MRRGSKANRVLDFWLGIPVLNLLACARLGRRAVWPRSLRGQPRRIGVMCSPALGDTLLFSSVLEDLRRYFAQPSRFPEPVEIVHFCMKPNLAAAELISGADRRVLIDLTRPAATVRQMRAEKLDALFDFTSWQRLTAFYTLTSGARFTAGFATAGQYRGRGYDLAVAHRNDRHEVENFRALLHALRISTWSSPRLEVSPADAAEPLGGIDDIVVFHLWAAGQQSGLREWPEDRWLELARRLADPATVFAITGSPADLPRTEPFVARMRAAGLACEPFVGTDGFRGLARMLRRARLVVSVNTGVMHLAAIVGAPTVAINGPTNNRRWGPVGPRAIGIVPPGEGCGYLNLGFEFAGQATDCMERVTVEMVVDAAEAVIRMPASPNQPAAPGDDGEPA